MIDKQLLEDAKAGNVEADFQENFLVQKKQAYI